MTRYVNRPKKLKKKFDLIIVDGRKRVRCFNLAKTLLKPGGKIILHDAWRKEYLEALNKNEGYFLTENLWITK